MMTVLRILTVMMVYLVNTMVAGDHDADNGDDDKCDGVDACDDDNADDDNDGTADAYADEVLMVMVLVMTMLL
eukprot:1373180-Pyramimonas_sp.AAC.1